MKKAKRKAKAKPRARAPEHQHDIEDGAPIDFDVTNGPNFRDIEIGHGRPHENVDPEQSTPGERMMSRRLRRGDGA